MAQSNLDKSYGLLGHYAGFASRFVALLLDGLIIFLALGIVNMAIFTVQVLFQLAVLNETVRTQWGALSELITTIAEPTPGLIVVISSIVIIIYHIFFLATAGRTPGKAFMGLRVLTTGGNRVSFVRAVLRLVGYVLSALPIFAGFVLVLLDDRRQCFHDKLAGTYVVYAWRARPDEQFLVREIQNLSRTPSTAGQTGDSAETSA
jgi:uncharacterized RDD family membrane protein YckC